MEVLFIASLVWLNAVATSFPKDLQPISTVGPEDSWMFPSFNGLVLDNHTQYLDFQRMIRINQMLYIAARDHVFALNLSASVDQIIPEQRLVWKSKDVEKCTMRGKNIDECYNYIKVLVPRNDETLFACGTNAFNPTCRNYRLSSLEQVGAELVGQARCPFESHQLNVGIFAGGHFYSATMSDFQASDAVIYRSLGGEGSLVLRSVKYDSKWLREPRFLQAFEYGSYVYFFFSEIAVEYTALGKVVYSRVARVCKNDSGGSARVLERYWTSFLKARLNCSIPGDSFFYFDMLQSVSSIIQINQRPAVVGVFTTQVNSIPGSAVCGFYMDEIEQVFQGRFKEQRGADSAWSIVPEEQVPMPRPGSCAGDGSASAFSSSVLFPDSMLSFIKAHPLMEECVSSINNQPFFTQTSSSYKLTQIVVDTMAGPYKNHTVIFLGSEDGRVLKVLMSSNPNSSQSTTLLEDIHVYNPSKCNGDRRVLGLELDKGNHALFVAFSSCIIRVPLSLCSQHGNCKSGCLSSLDPYCIWLKTEGCTNVSQGFKEGFDQDIDDEQSEFLDTCNELSSEAGQHNPEMDLVFGVSSVVESSSSSIHYTLLIMCVLGAFVCGTFLTALVVTWYCGQQGQQVETSDPQAKIGLAKLSSLLEPQAHIASEQIYCSFLQNGVINLHAGPTGCHLDKHKPSLPSPDSPKLTNSQVFANQWEPKLNCSSSLKKVPTQQAFPFTQSLNDNEASVLTLLHNQSASPVPSQSPAVSQSLTLMDMAAKDKFKHTHQVVTIPPEGDRIDAVTMAPLPNTFSPVCGQIPGVVAPYCSSSTLPQDHKLLVELQTARDREKEKEVKQKSESPVCLPSYRLSLIKMGSRPAVSRQHSFNQQRALQDKLLTFCPSRNTCTKTHGLIDHSNGGDELNQSNGGDELNQSYRADGLNCSNIGDELNHSNRADGLNCSNGGDEFNHSNGGDELNHSNRADGLNCSNGDDVFYRPLLSGASCLTRQHSYSEQTHTHTQRSAIIRRTASFKPHTQPNLHSTHSQPHTHNLT